MRAAAAHAWAKRRGRNIGSIVGLSARSVDRSAGRRAARVPSACGARAERLPTAVDRAGAERVAWRRIRRSQIVRFRTPWKFTCMAPDTPVSETEFGGSGETEVALAGVRIRTIVGRERTLKSDRARCDGTWSASGHGRQAGTVGKRARSATGHGRQAGPVGKR